MIPPSLRISSNRFWMLSKKSGCWLKERKEIEADRIFQKKARAEFRLQQQRAAAAMTRAEKTRAELKVTCRQLFDKTADKKVSDLTIVGNHGRG